MEKEFFDFKEGWDTLKWKPQEDLIAQESPRRNFSVGILKDQPVVKRKVFLTPESINQLVEAGVTVLVERGSGLHAGISDLDYANMGAEIIDTSDLIINEVNIVVKLSPFTLEEAYLFKQNQIILSSLNFPAAPSEFFTELTRKKITAIALNFIKDRNGNPLLDSIVTHTKGNVAASIALSNLVISLLFSLVNNSSLKYAIQTNPAILQGTYFYKGILANEEIAGYFHLPWKDIVWLCWDWN